MEKNEFYEVQMTTELSRRNFLKGAATAGMIGVVGAAFAGCAPTVSGDADAPAQTPGFLPETWDVETEFVILGAGCAGIAAALEAEQQGVKALIFEKEPEATAGGDSRCNGGMLNVVDAESDVVNSFGEMDATWSKTFTDEMLTIIPWFKENDGFFISDTEDTPRPLIEGSGPAVYEVLKGALAKSTIEVQYSTPASELIVNPLTNEVVGVYALSGGSKIAVKASKGVLIATGSYTASKELTDIFHLPHYEYYSYGSPALTGDGLTMGLSVGAALSKISMGHEWWSLAVREASEVAGAAVMAETPAQSRIIVNANGKRFMNENTMLIHNKSLLPFKTYTGSMVDGWHGVNGYINVPFYAVFDDTCFKAGPLGNSGDPSGGWAAVQELYLWSADNQAELDKGWIIKADTLEELASKIKITMPLTGEAGTIDGAALAQTVATFNAACAAGADTEFQRPPIFMAPISTPPYYALQLAPALGYTIGGLKNNEKSQVIDWNGSPIPRLYSAGDIGMNTYCVPVGVPGSMAAGRFAARDVATLSAWEA